MIRAALWFIVLFALATALALLAVGNNGMVSLFWQPWQVTMSLNMAVLLLTGLFVLLHLALRGLTVLETRATQRRQRQQQHCERAILHALLEAQAHLQAGSFVGAHKAAQQMLQLCESPASRALPQLPSLRVLALHLCAESAHALQDRTARDTSHQRSLQLQADGRSAQDGLFNTLGEGAHLCAARWALHDRDPDLALRHLAQLSQGAARRTSALRIRLKAQRLRQDNASALDTARLLARQGTFAAQVAPSIIRSLLIAHIVQIHDSLALQQLWSSLEDGERSDPDLALALTSRLLALARHAPAPGSVTRAAHMHEGMVDDERAWARQLASQWLLPVWQRQWPEDGGLPQPQHGGVSGPASSFAHADALSDAQVDRLCLALVQARCALDDAWLQRIESAQRNAPRDGRLHYLMGMACVQRQLWGKAGRHLLAATRHLDGALLRAEAWRALARLAERHQDQGDALRAWREAAMCYASADDLDGLDAPADVVASSLLPTATVAYTGAAPAIPHDAIPGNDGVKGTAGFTGGASECPEGPSHVIDGRRP